MQDFGFGGGGRVTRNMGVVHKHYFVRCHGSLKRGAFAGGSGGDKPPGTKEF